MRFRRAPTGAPVPAGTVSVFQSTVKGPEDACDNQRTSPTHLSPLRQTRWQACYLKCCSWKFLPSSTVASFLRLSHGPLVPMSGPSKPWEMVANTRRQRVRSLLFQAAVWVPTIGEKDSLLEALSEQPDWDDSPAVRWPGCGRPRQRPPEIANAANARALRSTSDYSRAGQYQ